MLAKSLTRGRDQRKPAEVFPNKKTYRVDFVSRENVGPIFWGRQIIVALAEVTANGGLVRKSPPKGSNSSGFRL